MHIGPAVRDLVTVLKHYFQESIFEKCKYVIYVPFLFVVKCVRSLCLSYLSLISEGQIYLSQTPVSFTSQ